MALSDENLGAAKSTVRGAVSRRPIVIVGMTFGGLGVLAVALTTGASAPTEQVKPEAVYVPDEDSAARLLAANAEPAALSTLPTDQTLEVTGSVAPLPNDIGLGGTPPASLIDQRRAQFDHFILEAEKQTLDSRLRARSAPLRVAAFDQARAAEEERAQRELEAFGKSGLLGGDGDAAEGLAALGPLAMAGAAPALAALSGGGGGPSMGGGGPGWGGGPDVSQVLQQLTSGGGMGAGGGGWPQQQQDPNYNAAKLDFFRNGGRQLEPGRLGASVREAYSPYELQMGAVIPGIMISGISSEAPGQIIGQVAENVYDSATGRFLLIPQGSRLVGTYSALIAHGQARVQVAWVRLNFPNGSKLDLGGMSGTDQGGVSGFKDRVNRHFGARLAAALMTTAFSITYELTAPQNGGFYEGAVHRGAGQSILQLGTDMARQEGQIPPTIEIRPGYRFNIAVSKDIVFPGPYDDGIRRRTRR